MADDMRGVLERIAHKIHARRDELIPLVIEGERDESKCEEDFNDRRAALLRARLENKDEREALSFSPWSSPSFDFLDDREMAICREFGIWWPGIVGELSHGPTFEFPPELCRSSHDEKWPFNLSDAPTTRGAAALFLAEVHDTFYRIGGNGVFGQALRRLESENVTSGPEYARLAAKCACYASGDFGPEHLFPDAFHREPVAACDIEAALMAMMGVAFGEAVPASQSRAQTANDESGEPAGESRAIQTTADPTPQPDSGPVGQIAELMNAKRSTQKGEGQAKLIAALTKHHNYADGGCLILDPINNNKLARQAGVSPSTASEFFKKQFKGHTKYRALCRDSTRLAWAMKMLNQEFSPHDLYGSEPPGERERDDE